MIYCNWNQVDLLLVSRIAFPVFELDLSVICEHPLDVAVERWLHHFFNVVWVRIPVLKYCIRIFISVLFICFQWLLKGKNNLQGSYINTSKMEVFFPLLFFSFIVISMIHSKIL